MKIVKFIVTIGLLSILGTSAFAQKKATAVSSPKQPISLDELDKANSIISAGDAAYKQQKYLEAGDLYVQAASLPVVAYRKDRIYYNAARAFAKAGKEPEAFRHVEQAVGGLSKTLRFRVRCGYCFSSCRFTLEENSCQSSPQ